MAPSAERIRPGATWFRRPGDRFERRFRAALVLALTLHASAMLVARHLAPHPRPAPEPLHFLDVTLLTDTPRPTSNEPVTAPEAATASRDMDDRVAARTLPPARAGAVTEAPAATVATPEAAPETPAAETTGEPSPPRTPLSLDALGIGNQNPFFAMKGIGNAAAEPAPPPAPSSERPDRTRVAEQRLKGYLVAGMLAHDRAVGASRNGAVATALQTAALQVVSPVNGRAEFVAMIDATGLVTALRPTRVSSNTAAWRNVASHALRQLKKKRLHVPAGAAGLEVRLALSSKVQLPSGSTAGPTVHQIPLMNADGTRLSRLEPSPENNKLPDAVGPPDTGMPLMRQPMAPSGLDGDLADLGGAGQRIVHVTITDERPL